LLGIEAGGESFDCGDEDGDEEVDEEPREGEDVRADRDDEVWEGEDNGEREPQGRGKGLRGADAGFAGESEGEKRNKKKDQRDDRWEDGERGVHIFIVAGRWELGSNSDRKIGGL